MAAPAPAAAAAAASSNGPRAARYAAAEAAQAAIPSPAAIDVKAPTVTGRKARRGRVDIAAIEHTARVDAALARSAPPSRLAAQDKKIANSTAAVMAAWWVLKDQAALAHEHKTSVPPAPGATSGMTDHDRLVMAAHIHKHFLNSAQHTSDYTLRTKTADASAASARNTLPECLWIAAVLPRAFKAKAARPELRQAKDDAGNLAQFFWARDMWSKRMNVRRIEVLENELALRCNRLKPVTPDAKSHAKILDGTADGDGAYRRHLIMAAQVSFWLRFIVRISEYPIKHSTMIDEEKHVKPMYNCLRLFLLNEPANQFRIGGQEHIKEMSLPLFARQQYQRANRENEFYFSTDDVLASGILTGDEIQDCNLQQRAKVDRASGFTVEEINAFHTRRAKKFATMETTKPVLLTAPEHRPAAAAAAAAAVVVAADSPAPAAAAASASSGGGANPPTAAAVVAKPDLKKDEKDVLDVDEAENIKMTSATEDVWILQAFRAWFRASMSYDVVVDHAITWYDWVHASKSEGLLTDKNPTRLPLMVCLGSNEWFVYHKGDLLHTPVTERQPNLSNPCDRALVRAIALWCMIVVTEYQGMAPNGRRLSMVAMWPEVVTPEFVPEAVKTQRKTTHRWMTKMPDPQHLLR